MTDMRIFRPTNPDKFFVPEIGFRSTVTELSECIKLAMEYLAITQTFWRLRKRRICSPVKNICWENELATCRSF